MTISNNKGKKTAKGTKKLSLKKETVKDLDSKPGKGKELGDDQLDAVNGGAAWFTKPFLPRSKHPADCTATRASRCCS